MTVIISGVIGKGETRSCKLWLWSWAKSCTASPKYKSIKLKVKGAYDTLEEHWAVTLWDLSDAPLGKRSGTDHKGGDLAGVCKDLEGLGICPKSKEIFVCWGILGYRDCMSNDIGCHHWSRAGQSVTSAQMEDQASPGMA